MIEGHPQGLSPATLRSVWAIRSICFVLLATMVVLAALLVAAPSLLIGLDADWPPAVLLDGPLRWVARGLGLVLLLPPIWAASSIARLCTAFLRGEVMALGPADRLRGAGTALVVLAPLSVASRPAFDLLTGLAEGGGSVSITVQGADLALLAGGLLLRTLGQVLGDAARLADENRAFI